MSSAFFFYFYTRRARHFDPADGTKECAGKLAANAAHALRQHSVKSIVTRNRRVVASFAKEL